MRMVGLVAVVVLASTAHAEKPTIAVLGVIPRDASLVKSTIALDAGLRTQLAASYRVKGTARQVEAAIRTADCSTHETACAAKLGAALGADFALAGELEKRGTHVELTIQIVDVANKQRVRVHRDKVAGTADFRKLAKKAVNALTGKGEIGQLVVMANVARAQIYIDDELRGELFENRATITLPQGRHKLVIVARDKPRFEDLVTVEETTRLNVLLD